jgi:glucose-1-phosphate adenylyltransferase
MVEKTLCIILGGGAGSRLYPLTADRSKPAVPFAGKYRLIDIPVSNCLNAGISQIFVLTQFNSASLNRHINKTYHFDHFKTGFVDILAAEQTPDSRQWFMGTADAVRQTLPHALNYDFDYLLILSGDQLYQMDLEKFILFHEESKADISVASLPVDSRDAQTFGIMKVQEDGRISDFIEKPAEDILDNWKSEVSDELKGENKEYLASMGIYIFNRKKIVDLLLKEQKDAMDFGKEIIPVSIAGGDRVFSYPYDGYWSDIGTIRSFFEENIALTTILPQFNLFDNENLIFTHPRMLSPSKVQDTHIKESLIADGCIINASFIFQSVIGIRSRIGHSTTITQAIIMGNDYYESIDDLEKEVDIPMGVGEHCHIQRAIIDKNCRVGNNVIINGSHAETGFKEEELHYIVDGVVVLKKGVTIPNGYQIVV